MAEPFIGQISMFGGNYAPRGWALCDGQLLPISQNTALFSLLGTNYGGDGRTTFGLPDLRGRAPVHAGTGPGLSPVSIGQVGGAESFTITAAQLPAHSHQVAASTSAQTTNRPTNGYLAAGNRYTTAAPDASMGPTATTGAGASIAHRSPYTAVNFIIALVGIFPSRS